MLRLKVAFGFFNDNNANPLAVDVLLMKFLRIVNSVLKQDGRTEMNFTQPLSA